MNRELQAPTPRKKLRVCLFTETYYPAIGGGETQARLLAEALVANSDAALILTRRHDPQLPAYEQYRDVPVYRLPPAGGGQLKKWGLLCSGFPALLRLRREYDLIFVSGYRIIGIAAVLASRLLGKKCLLKADSRGEMSGEFFREGLKKIGRTPDWLPFRWFLRVRNAILSRADAFVAISAEIAGEYRAAGIPPERLLEIPNGVDTREFHPASPEEKQALREKLELPRNATIVVYTGRLVTYKGLPLLLQVWKELVERRHNFYLVLVGAGGLDMHNCEAELREYVAAQRLGETVRFTSNVENVAEYLQAADIFAFPTEEDAFPAALIEAMACALPVITTPVGAIQDIIIDQENGILIQPGAFDPLYQAIDRLASESNNAAQLGQGAFRSVQTQYSAAVVTQRYLKSFQDILQGQLNG